MLASYNQWANNRLYEAASRLSEVDYRRDCGAFFKSIHGTLNHILVADRLWMARFKGDLAPPHGLDDIIFEAFWDLRAARQAEDEKILHFMEAQDEVSLNAEMTYRTVVNPLTVTQLLAPALDHFFNHQTHHRGQAHALLTRLGGEAPSLDLIFFQRETGTGGLKILH